MQVETIPELQVPLSSSITISSKKQTYKFTKIEDIENLTLRSHCSAEMIRNRKDEIASSGQPMQDDDKKINDFYPLVKKLIIALIIAIAIALLGLNMTSDRNIMSETGSKIHNYGSFRGQNSTTASLFANIASQSEGLKGSRPSAPAVDKCSNLWTSDKLVGRCFGLKSFTDYGELKDVQSVDSADQCKSLCCQLGWSCITWQYWVGIKRCKLGGIVRLGKESAPTPNWCEPLPPIKWTGHKVASREADGASVKWDGEDLTTQCFGTRS